MPRYNKPLGAKKTRTTIKSKSSAKLRTKRANMKRKLDHAEGKAKIKNIRKQGGRDFKLQQTAQQTSLAKAKVYSNAVTTSILGMQVGDSTKAAVDTFYIPGAITTAPNVSNGGSSSSTNNGSTNSNGDYN